MTDSPAEAAAKKWPTHRDSTEQGLVDKAIKAGEKTVANADHDARRAQRAG